MKNLLLAASAAWLLAGYPAAAADPEMAAVPNVKVVSDVRLNQTISLHGRALSLTGCGTRRVFWTDLYVAALYLPEAGIAALGRADHPKAVRLTILRRLFMPDEIPGKYRVSLQESVPQPILQSIDRRFADLSRGDTLWLTYTPEEGSVVAVNDTFVAKVPGHGPITAILNVWGGEKKSWQRKLDETLAKHPC